MHLHHPEVISFSARANCSFCDECLRTLVSIELFALRCNAKARGGNVKHVKECGWLLDVMYQQIPEMCLDTTTR